jgi:CBS-domain-containing membrane protein
MSTPPVTISPWRRISEAAHLMTERRINRLPVVDDTGRLVGIVSRADLVRVFVRSDEELAHTIRHDVLEHGMLLDPAVFDVVVTDGVAFVTGTVERRSTAELVGRVVAMVPGVLDTRTDVAWWRDDSRPSSSESGPEFPPG